MRTHLRLLSKVSLWTELHWAILGGIKVSLLFNGLDHKCCRNGEECSCKPWWCPTAANLSVCLITHLFHIILIAHWYLAMQTGQCNSSQPMHKVFQAHRLFGPTKSTMVIGLYLLTSLLLSRRPWNCNLQSKAWGLPGPSLLPTVKIFWASDLAVEKWLHKGCWIRMSLTLPISAGGSLKWVWVWVSLKLPMGYPWHALADADDGPLMRHCRHTGAPDSHLSM